jgi:hypothetical protein
MRDAFCCDCQHPDGYVVTVDRSMTLDQMLAAGDYREVPSLDPHEFPIPPGGRGDVRLHMLHLFEETTYEEVLATLARRKEKPARPEELLALGARYPEAQRRNVILALGAINGDPLFPCWATALALSGDAEGRYVETRFLENGIPAGTHILVLR